MRALPPSRKPSKVDRKPLRSEARRKKPTVLTQIDHLVVATDDLEVAQAQCVALLGRSPSWSGDHPGSGTRHVIFRLANTCVELRAPGGEGQGAEELSAHLAAEGPGLFALALATEDAGAAVTALHGRGLSPGEAAETLAHDDPSGAFRRSLSARLPAKDTRGIRLFIVEHLSEPELLPLALPEGEADAVEDDRPRYSFFGATEDAWIGKIWPRGRAWEHSLSTATIEDNFCNAWSGGLNFLRRGFSGSEVSVDPNGDVFPCCLKTARPLGSLREERLDDILDSLIGHPAFEAGAMGHPERMGLTQGWSVARFLEASRTTTASGCLLYTSDAADE